MKIEEARKKIERIEYPLEYDPDKWSYFNGANCYPYALGIETNESFLIGDLIGRRVTEKDSDSTKLYVLKEELEALGFEVEECDTSDYIDEEHSYKIYLEINDATGEYHVLRCDSDGLWSHKAADFKPNRMDTAGYLICDPDDMVAPGYHGWCFMLYRY